MSQARVEGAPSNAGSARSTVLRARRLIGRDSEIRDVIDCVASAPVTTLVGPGGVGKTALSIHVAAQCAKDFPDGVTIVWLASVRSAELVAAEVAVQLGLTRLGGQSYEDALTIWLTERDVLLVIDNCEHVVSAVADLVHTLTLRLPRLRVLATSREPLCRLAELDEELDAAEAHHDGAKHAKRTAEREALVAEIKRATGLGGKPRRAGSPTEKARLNVTRTIRHAINYLATTAPELAAHLDESLVTGVSCCYEPRTNIAWTV